MKERSNLLPYLKGGGSLWAGRCPLQPSSAPWAGVMGAARASTAGHLPPAFNAMNEAQTA